MKEVCVSFTFDLDLLDEITSKSLSDFTVSSTVTHGPDAAFLKSILEALNEACLSNQPEKVAKITAAILNDGVSTFMDISRVEIILAHIRAVTLLDPDIPVKDYFEALMNLFYQCHTIS